MLKASVNQGMQEDEVRDPDQPSTESKQTSVSKNLQPNVPQECILCLNGLRKVYLTEGNTVFLNSRLVENTINEAVDIARIAWHQFPRLRESADADRIIELIMQGLQEKLNAQLLSPMANTTTALSAIINRLDAIAQSNPAVIEQGFRRTLDGLRLEISSIKTAIQEPTSRLTELSSMVSQVIYKPIVRGNVGEAVLMDRWLEAFPRDQVERAGGAGREDLTIIPHLSGASINGSKYGERISLEKKTGKQRFNGSHQLEAIRHAKETGASYALLVYDNQDNLPQTIQPVSISQQDGVLIAVSDLQSGSWKIMREIIEVIQQQLRQSSDISAMDVNAIQQVISELASVVKVLEQVKSNSYKIKSCAEEIDQSVVSVKALVKSHEGRLTRAITATNNEPAASKIKHFVS